MSSGTTPNGYPYPNGDEPINKGDDAIKALALKLDAVIPFAMAVGLTNLVAPGATTNPSVALVFPVGRFTQIPAVLAVLNTGTVNYLTNVGAVTVNGATVTMFHNTAGQSVAAATYVVGWVAVQMRPGSTSG